MPSHGNQGFPLIPPTSSSFLQVRCSSLSSLQLLIIPEQRSYSKPNCLRCPQFHLKQKALRINLGLLFKLYPSLKVQNKSYHLEETSLQATQTSPFSKFISMCPCGPLITYPCCYTSTVAFPSQSNLVYGNPPPSEVSIFFSFRK